MSRIDRGLLDLSRDLLQAMDAGDAPAILSARQALSDLVAEIDGARQRLQAVFGRLEDCASERRAASPPAARTEDNSNTPYRYTREIRHPDGCRSWQGSLDGVAWVAIAAEPGGRLTEIAEELAEIRRLLEEAVVLLGDEFFAAVPPEGLREKRYAFWYKACQWFTHRARAAEGDRSSEDAADADTS